LLGYSRQVEKSKGRLTDRKRCFTNVAAVVYSQKVGVLRQLQPTKNPNFGYSERRRRLIMRRQELRNRIPAAAGFRAVRRLIKTVAAGLFGISASRHHLSLCRSFSGRSVSRSESSSQIPYINLEQKKTPSD